MLHKVLNSNIFLEFQSMHNFAPKLGLEDAKISPNYSGQTHFRLNQWLKKGRENEYKTGIS